jgi:subtilisin
LRRRNNELLLPSATFLLFHCVFTNERVKYMKVKLLTIFISLILVSGFAFADSGSDKTRYLVKSNNNAIKGMFGITHAFDSGFSTDLSPGQLKALSILGVEVEEVLIYELLGKPVCGDNVCQGAEPKTCPEDCSDVPPEPDPDPVRTCYPSTQNPYGVLMVNGGSGGAGVNVAVLDSGVKTDHPDLTVSMCKDTTKRGVKEGCSDKNGHGTHVAGTIAANGGADGQGIYGVAPEANLMAIKVCGPTGSCYSDDIAAGIYHATDNGANIISMSLGSDSESSLIRDAIDYASANGVLVVAAAGNDGPTLGSIDYPGANAKVVAVAALDSSENVAEWSSRGINDGDYVVEAMEVELAGPGVAVESTYKDGCYAVKSGTSMATPHISGLAAKLWQGSAASTRMYLQNISKDIHTLGDDAATGFGLPIAPN